MFLSRLAMRGYSIRLSGESSTYVHVLGRTITGQSTAKVLFARFFSTMTTAMHTWKTTQPNFWGPASQLIAYTVVKGKYNLEIFSEICARQASSMVRPSRI